MPEYLAPGVFIEEVSYRAKSIEGVGTSVAGLVGPTRTGPLRGKPELLTSFADYVRIYGDVGELTFSGAKVLNHTAIAAKAFFDGGGTKLFVQRVAAGVNGTDAQGVGSSAAFATVADAGGKVTFNSRFPGLQNNYTLELHWRDSENLLTVEEILEPPEGEVVYMVATGITGKARLNAAVKARIGDNRFPLNITGLVKRVGNQLVMVDNLATITPDPSAVDQAATPAIDFRPAVADADGVLLLAGIEATSKVIYTRVRTKSPRGSVLADGTFAVLSLSAITDVHTFTGGITWGTLRTLRGTIDATGTKFTPDNSGLNPAIVIPPQPAHQSFYLAALAAVPSSAQAVAIQRNFDLDVYSGGSDGELVYRYSNISTAPTGDSSLPSVLAPSPAKKADALTSPISAKLAASATGAEIIAALYKLFNQNALFPPANSVSDPRYLIQLGSGGDGTAPSSVDYGGQINEVKGNTGFAALEDIEDIAIVLAPAAAADSTNHYAIVVEMQKHVRKMRYRIGIVDPRDSWSLSEVRDFRSNFNDSRLALYYPWVVIADPSGAGQTINVPPAGFVAGVYANTDVQRGVHKAPANETVVGALRFSQNINRFQQELLNPEGINVLRSFPGRGHLVWGGRTLSNDPEWKYVNVRRYFLYLERSIEKSTQWVVFEPNGERLWANVRTTVEDFLYNEWFNGRLLGPTAKSAYFVRCDRSTMTQNDLDNGRLVVEVGVAPLRPAEFVIFRIGQKTAEA